MIVDAKSPILCNFCLATFNFGIIELLDDSALDAHQVIVMVAVVQFENGFARLEMMANQQPGLFELGKHAINGCQPDFHAIVKQQPVHVFCREMALFAVLEKIEDLEAGQRRLQPPAFQILRRFHFRTDHDE